MNDELELNQAGIDELLATANKDLSELDAPPEEAPTLQEPSLPEELIPPLQVAPPIKNKALLFIMTLKQHLTKKIVFLFFLLLAVVIGIGGYLGYKMASHQNVSQTPLEKIIQQGITFEEKNFVAAAGRGDNEIVNAFLDAGMSVNVVRPIDGWSPLIAASFYKNSDIVKLLLDQQATVDLQDKYGRTALMQATAMGAEDIVTMLLANGANPNLQDNNGRTALIESYSKQYAEIAEILKNAGANPAIEPPKPVVSPPQPPKEEVLPDNIVAENRLTIGKAGYIQIGMPLADVQQKYPSITVTTKYVDGVKKAIANVYLNNQTSPTLELELSSGKLKLVSTISTTDEHFTTDKQITIKSTVEDIRNQYTISDIKVINNSPFLVVKSIKMLFELDMSNGVSLAEWLDTGNPSSIPATTKIKRIVLY